VVKAPCSAFASDCQRSPAPVCQRLSAPTSLNHTAVCCGQGRVRQFLRWDPHAPLMDPVAVWEVPLMGKWLKWVKWVNVGARAHGWGCGAGG
jgi:hypothetical protein